MFRVDAAFSGELRENWRILLIAFAVLFFGFSAPAYALPFLYPEVIAEFGWTREQATLLASAKYLTGAVASILVGRFLDLTGVWIALLLSISIGGLALVGFLFIGDLTTYYIAGVMLGIAGPGAMVTVFVMMARTFREAQGTATGIALLGTGLGGVVMPLVTAALIGAVGWRAGMALLSLGIWLIAIPLLIYGMRAVPVERADNPTPAASDKPADGGPITYIGRLMRGHTFWLLSLAFFLVTIVDQALVQHQVLMFNDAGVSPEMAALGVSLIGLLSMAGRILAGTVLDRYSNRGLALFYLLLTVVALLCLFLTNPAVFALFIVLRALAHAGVMIDGPVLGRHCFGVRHLGVLLGLFTAMANIGSATGPWLMARLFDQTGSYDNALLLFTLLPLVSAVMILIVKPKVWLQQRGLPTRYWRHAR